MSAPTVLITGIGLEIAVGAARAGWRSVATLREVTRADRLRAAAGVADLLDVRRRDVVDQASVAACVAGAFAAAQSPADAAAVVVGTLTDPEPDLRVQTSPAARQFIGVKLADLDGFGVTAVTAGWLR